MIDRASVAWSIAHTNWQMEDCVEAGGCISLTVLRWG